MINIKNLHKHFGKLEVLKGIDLEIASGEVVVVIGPSGSGKSTFLRCLNLLEQPTAGNILFENKDLMAKQTNVNELRQKMGMVFQNFNLFPHKNVLENLMLAPMKVKNEDNAAAKKHALALLDKVGLADKATSFPSQLSGGQQQRVAIA
ncbi:arginine transport ATP-binding protein ArtM, partial [Listeria seeligeri FSL S4-171]